MTTSELLVEYVIYMIKSVAGLLFVFSPLVILALIIEWLIKLSDSEDK